MRAHTCTQLFISFSSIICFYPLKSFFQINSIQWSTTPRQHTFPQLSHHMTLHYQCLFSIGLSSLEQLEHQKIECLSKSMLAKYITRAWYVLFRHWPIFSFNLWNFRHSGSWRTWESLLPVKGKTNLGRKNLEGITNLCFHCSSRFLQQHLRFRESTKKEKTLSYNLLQHGQDKT